MAIRKYYISKDTTITNAYESNLIYRATGSNAGLSDTLQVFSIYGQASTSSNEKARILLFLESDDISVDRTNGLIPASGSCNFYLNLYNAVHPFSVPRNFKLCVSAIVGKSWDEGENLDDDEWSQEGCANWNQASTSSGTPVYWTSSGSDFWSGLYIPGTSPPTYEQSFDSGLENLRIDVTSLMEEWMSTAIANYGLCVYLTSSNESTTDTYYIKKFFARGSEYFFKRPTVTAEWDDSVRDDRGFLYASSSLCDSENINTIYLYNKIRGRYKTIPTALSKIYVRIYDDPVSGSLITGSCPITGGLVSTGIYSSSFALDTTSSVVYDRWYNSSLTTCYYTGSIYVKTFSNQGDNSEAKYVITMPGLRSSYKINEKPRLKLFIRDKDWKPTIYSVSNNDATFEPIKDLYYRMTRVIDNFIVQDYGTGSISTTRLSYDNSGSYFDYDMSNLQEDYQYRINYILKRLDGSSYEEVPQSFAFRVDKQSY